MKKVLIIAGSDSGCGAGIQADLKTVSSFGLWPLTVITALTAQNSRTVSGVHDVPPDFVEAQLKAVAGDFGVDAVKIGMLHRAEIAAVAARCIPDEVPVVLDPVMVAKDGSSLMKEETVVSLCEHLFLKTTLLTPNIPEAELLSGLSIHDVEGMKKAASVIQGQGPEAVLIKGGHLEGMEVHDVLLDRSGKMHRFSDARIGIAPPHGTGCAFSSAIAALLARGLSIVEAVAEARRFLRSAIRAAPSDVGKGSPVIDHLALLKRNAGRLDVLEALTDALEALKELPFAELVPEVQTNFAYALPWVDSLDDIAAFPGRIVKAGNRIEAVAPPAFGASRHIAKIVFTAVRRFPDCRSCLNLRYDPQMLSKAEQAGLTVCSFSRADEPEELQRQEGRSLEWGTDSVLQKRRTVPDIIYDAGGMGKEPMIRLLGGDPACIVEKVKLLLAPPALL